MNPFVVFPALSHSCPWLPHPTIWRCSLDSPPHLSVSFNSTSLSLSLSYKGGWAEPLRDLHKPGMGLGPGWHQLFFPEPPTSTLLEPLSGKGVGRGRRKRTTPQLSLLPSVLPELRLSKQCSPSPPINPSPCPQQLVHSLLYAHLGPNALSSEQILTAIPSLRRLRLPRSILCSWWLSYYGRILWAH